MIPQRSPSADVAAALLAAQETLFRFSLRSVAEFGAATIRRVYIVARHGKVCSPSRLSGAEICTRVVLRVLLSS